MLVSTCQNDGTWTELSEETCAAGGVSINNHEHGCDGQRERRACQLDEDHRSVQNVISLLQKKKKIMF